MTPNDKLAQKPKNVTPNTNLEDSKIRNNLTVSISRNRYKPKENRHNSERFLGDPCSCSLPEHGSYKLKSFGKDSSIVGTEVQVSCPLCALNEAPLTLGLPLGNLHRLWNFSKLRAEKDAIYKCSIT